MICTCGRPDCSGNRTECLACLLCCCKGSPGCHACDNCSICRGDRWTHRATAVDLNG